MTQQLREQYDFIVIGGVTAYSNGQRWVPMSHEEADAGIEDSEESGAGYLLRLGMEFAREPRKGLRVPRPLGREVLRGRHRRAVHDDSQAAYLTLCSYGSQRRRLQWTSSMWWCSVPVRQG
jgi:hypothetical protein